MLFDTIKLEKDNAGIAHIILARPEVHNAFNAKMIAELTTALNDCAKDDSRIICLHAEGKNFSAGADLNWMKSMKDYSENENLADAHKLAALMQALNTLPKPTVALAQGATIGGGVGLLACCDMVIAEPNASFALSEVSLGLVPAVISPYVIAAIGERQARRYFLTTERFNADVALTLGLVTELNQDLQAYFADIKTKLLRAGPKALAACKELIRRTSKGAIDADMQAYTAKLIAGLRVGDEAQEGLSAFFEKRSADWI